MNNLGFILYNFLEYWSNKSVMKKKDRDKNTNKKNKVLKNPAKRGLRKKNMKKDTIKCHIK